MVAASGARVVSFRDEENTSVVIPRPDPRDKSSLWFSRTEIRQNTMMSRVRHLVQSKLIETLWNDDQDDETEDASQHLDEKLRRKAEMVQTSLERLMEQPYDEILAFLESGNLPAGVLGPCSPESEASNPAGQHRISGTGGTPNSTDLPSNKEDDELFNWILDSDDEWQNLPAVVKISAREIGYTEELWNEDSQDMPIFCTPWDRLTRNQQTAVRFLGWYDEAVWNEDVEIMLERRNEAMMGSASKEQSFPAISGLPLSSKDVVLASIQDSEFVNTEDDDSNDNGHKTGSSDVNNTSSSGVSIPLDQEGDQSFSRTTGTPSQSLSLADDDDEEISEFISNFLVQDKKEQDDNDEKENDKQKEKTKHAIDVHGEDEDDELVMNEFISNFLQDETKDENAQNATAKSSQTTSVNSQKRKQAHERYGDESMIEEFISNFLPETIAEQDDRDTTTDTHRALPVNNEIDSPAREEKEEEELMVDEFISNFLSDERTDEDTKTKDSQTEGVQPEPPSNRQHDFDQERDGQKELEVIVEEFMTNFVQPPGHNDSSDGKNMESPSPTNDHKSDGPVGIPEAKTTSNRQDNHCHDNDQNEEVELRVKEFMTNFVQPPGYYEKTTDSGDDKNVGATIPTKDRHMNDPGSSKCTGPPGSSPFAKSSYLWISVAAAVVVPLIYLLMTNGSPHGYQQTLFPNGSTSTEL